MATNRSGAPTSFLRLQQMRGGDPHCGDQSECSRELIDEFNKASDEAPSKRKRMDGGMIYVNGKDYGESMFQTLVNRAAAEPMIGQSGNGPNTIGDS